MRRMIKKIGLFAACCFPVCFPVHAQQTGSPGQGSPLAEERSNRFIFPGDSEKNYETLFLRLNELVLRGEGTLQIVHIGDSHIQAGFLPEEMRRNFASGISSGCGARGLVFPYRIAKTNNPADYTVKFTGKWEQCRNVEINKSCLLGLTGIAVETRDTLAEMTFRFRNTAVFREFKSIRIFHGPVDTSLRISFPGLEGRYSADSYLQEGFTRISFDSVLDSLKIRIVRKDTAGTPFRLYGIDFENGDPGIVYSAAGVNGAEVTSFLRCDLLGDQLHQLRPDWIILSLGTNDAYPLNFEKARFVEGYKALVNAIRKDNPGVPVLLTTPGDSYRKRRYDNLNLLEAREGIFQVASETRCAVWDFYTIMGGPRSILQWYKAGLVARDKLHFDKQGYVIQGDLLFSAFMDAWASFIDKQE